MTYLQTPIKLQLEISSMCNALCPGCARTDYKNFNQKHPIIPDKKILSLDIIRKFLKEFTTVYELDFCGTVDDPFMHPHFNEILEIALENGIRKVYIHTNGGVRNPDYWKRTAEILQKFPAHHLKFSVDGLEDTNHLYRQNTKWDKIMSNAQAFIDAGGNAGWQYIIFPWNEHQVDEARELSKQMGFNNFIERIDRSLISHMNVGLDKIQEIKKLNHKSTVETQMVDIDFLYNKFKPLEDNPIECFFQKEQMYFVDFNARLWPCCFIRNTEFGGYNSHWHQVKKVMFESYNNLDWNRLDMYTVEEIINHPYYKNDLVDSFSNGYGATCGSKLVKCSATCSKKIQENRPIAKFKIEELQ